MKKSLKDLFTAAVEEEENEKARLNPMGKLTAHQQMLLRDRPELIHSPAFAFLKGDSARVSA